MCLLCSLLAGTWIVRLALYFFYKQFERSVGVNALSFDLFGRALDIFKFFKIEKKKTFSIKLFITSRGTLINP